MRYLRFRILINFLTKTRNKKKALNFINIGIFLSVFALTTAIISFYTERKININEFYANEIQDIRSDLIASINYLEKVNSIRSYTNITEYLNQQDNDLFQSTIYGSMALSDKDYYSPFIYVMQNSEILGNDEIYDEENISNLNEMSSPELQKRIKVDIDRFLEAKKRVLEIDFKKYEKDLFNNSLKKLNDEINASVKNKRNSKTGEWNDGLDESFYDYNAVELLINYTIDYEENVLFVYRGIENNLTRNITELENQILEYSKNEKILILITFLVQFIVFMIIQLFEISSIPSNLIRKKR